MSTRPTENEVQEALAVIRRDYYADVRSIAEEYTKAKTGDDEKDQETLHQLVDGAQRVIYTYQAKLGLLISDNEDAYQDEFGEPPPTIEAQMYVALTRDVLEYLNLESK